MKTVSVVIGLVCALLVATSIALHCTNPWVMERIGYKDLGVNWVSPIQEMGGSWLVASDNGTLVRIDSATNHFERIEIGTCEDVRGLTFVGNSILAGCRDGGLYISTDNGISWNPAGTVLAEITSMATLANQTVAICTINGTVSLWDAASEECKPILTIPGAIFTCMDFHAGELTVLGKRGLIIHTTDQGVSWQQTQHDSTMNFSCCHRVNDSTLAIGGYKTRMYVSFDNGRTFYSQTQIREYPTKKELPDWDPVTCIAHLGDRIFFTGVFIPAFDQRFFKVYYSDDWGQTWQGTAYPESYENILSSTFQPVAFLGLGRDYSRIAIANKDDGIMQICTATNATAILPDTVKWESDTLLLSAFSKTEDYQGRTWLKSGQMVAADTLGGAVLGLVSWALNGYLPYYANSVYRSSNGGQDWTEIAKLPATILTMTTHGSAVLLGCDSGSVRLSTDGGEHFSERIFIDSTAGWNRIVVSGATTNGRFVTYATMQKTDSQGMKQGAIYTFDAQKNLHTMPFPRIAENDNLTPPYVHGNTVIAMYHVVDTSRNVQSSEILEWDVVSNTTASTTVTDLISSKVKYGAEVLHADSVNVWIAMGNLVYAFNRATQNGTYINDLSVDDPSWSANTKKKLIVGNNYGLCLRAYTVVGSQSPLSSWQMVGRCNGSTSGYVPYDAVSLGNRRYLIVGSPYNYVLTIPDATSVQEHESQNHLHAASLVVNAGNTFTLNTPEPVGIHCTDITGRHYQIEYSTTPTGVEISTRSLLPGLYTVVVYGRGTITNATVLVVR